MNTIINKINRRIVESEENQKNNLQNKQEEFIATSIGTEAVLMPVHIELIVHIRMQERSRLQEV